MSEITNINQEGIFGSDSPQAFVDIKFFERVNLDVVLLHEFSLIRLAFPDLTVSIVKQLKFFEFRRLAFKLRSSHY
jgi:hypothetical protein